ncbi:RNA polymerase sigma factor [Planotetraspora kaengkrachanensis]|nr:sigma factor [Planotetraspora kaengkrachanensis]
MDPGFRARVRAGDEAAFGVLFREHGTAVYNHCFRLTGDWSVAEDCASLVFLEAWRLREKVEPVPGLRYEGTTTDRAGRTGRAFSLDSDHGGLPNRKTLIVDPADGRIVDEEETLTETAGRLGVPIPSVISYTVYLEADTRPAPGR